jgi:gluconate 2-dehydrogenase gamma chain
MFLRAATAASAAWATVDLMQVEEALAWAAEQAPAPHVGAQHAAAGDRRAPRLSVLTKAQADALDAMTSRILPAVDGRPGAHEAGVIYFIDRSLATFNASQKTLYANGVADLNRRAAEKAGANGVGAANNVSPTKNGSATKSSVAANATTAGFATLTSAQQDAILHEIETTPFFQAIRFDTIVGTFALPTWGGNHDYVGWRMLGFEHQPAFQPPFGFYDAEINRKG